MRKTPRVVSVILAAALFLMAVPVRAAVKPHGLFTDGMVLQQGMKVPIWGTADDGEKVTVRFQNQEASAVAKDGRWMVRLNALTAGGPHSLTIEGSNRIELKNVLVGEVWICSGQSNMQWAINQSETPNEVKAKANHPQIRLFTVKRRQADKPEKEVQATGWQECTPETVGDFSAVAYFFGVDLNKARNVPIGLINTSFGGTAAEWWTSRPTLEANADLKDILESDAKAAAAYEKAVAAYKAAVEEAKKEGKKPPAALRPSAGIRAAGLYNAMISPLIPYGIRGAIWYQGESNAGRAFQYQALFSAMIKNWRQDWGQGDFPFLFVQLAPFYSVEKEPAEKGSAWAELRDAQLQTSLTVPNTGMAVITDLGHEADIHPNPKQPVGERLARIARATVYGEKIEYSGPVFKQKKIEGNKAVLHFTHTEGGLISQELVATDTRPGRGRNPAGSAWRVKPGSTGAPLTAFTVAGEDRKFHNAQAKIEGDTVIVWSDEVAKPIAVRYGWANYPLCNLFNSAGLPASPFRTDDFPLTTKPVASRQK